MAKELKNVLEYTSERRLFIGKITILKLSSIVSQEQLTEAGIKEFIALFNLYTKEAIQQVESICQRMWFAT